MTGTAEKGGRRRWSRAGWAAGAFMLLVALVAKQFIGEPNWIDNLAQTGTLLIGVGIAVELASRKTGQAAYRAAVGLALGSALLLGWVNGAVGIIGSENNEANLMYGGVIVVGAIGAVIARFKPEGHGACVVGDGARSDAGCRDRAGRADGLRAAGDRDH